MGAGSGGRDEAAEGEDGDVFVDGLALEGGEGSEREEELGAFDEVDGWGDGGGLGAGGVLAEDGEGLAVAADGGAVSEGEECQAEEDRQRERRGRE